ncbi:unnamed protein product [Prorocentrum cordatum]|uniref:Pentacotripeptide-repeat region of PRORP domain-containing protein n=1 Tax=Prorocentrum cordatum TaxID=2364126 RepID=A0ABN9V8C4_9DINO|nr:unnamed protein product [Polarella glacialis]
MPGAACAPDEFTHCALIGALGAAAEPDEAERHLRAVLRGAFPAAVSPRSRQVAFHAAMKARARTGDHARTRELLALMELSGVEPNLLHFNALLTSCAPLALAGHARDVFGEMLARRITPDIASWTVLVSCHRREYQRCAEIVSQMRSSSVEPGARALGELRRAALLAGAPPRARAPRGPGGAAAPGG